MLDRTVTHVSSGISYEPEDCPFKTVLVDVTHRCNMACNNCYIPNRELPDMDAEWLRPILKRLPRRRHVRLVGAEPTMRRDLPDLIKMVRETGHIPMILTNGLACAKRAYVAKLKAAGLRTIYISMNGGTNDDLYVALDSMACAKRKLAGLDHMCAENMHVTVGMNLARGVNEWHLGEFWRYLTQNTGARGLHLRSIGPLGRYMEGTPFSLDELVDLAREHLGLVQSELDAANRSESYLDTNCGSMELQLTQWPDLGSKFRGRLTPSGKLEPFFEHVMVNAARGGY